MNRTAISPSPAESVASSETSETQSVSDDVSTVSNFSSTRKRATIAKDAEKERPPWRPVSLATPSKADKNALLKAKMLDASRRALLLQRIAHTASQTDEVHTRMVREADVQSDPLSVCDQNVGTDGSMIVRHGVSGGGFIFTQTVGHMTDLVRSATVATQTARPLISLDFDQLYGEEVRSPNRSPRDPDPTLSVWQDLLEPIADDPDDYYASGRDDKMDAINQRLLNMHLYPVPKRPQTSVRPLRSADLMDRLVHEANAMLGTFQRVSLALGPKLLPEPLINVRPVSPMQPSKWDAVLGEACDRLVEKLDKLKR